MYLVYDVMPGPIWIETHPRGGPCGDVFVAGRQCIFPGILTVLEVRIAVVLVSVTIVACGGFAWYCWFISFFFSFMPLIFQFTILISQLAVGIVRWGFVLGHVLVLEVRLVNCIVSGAVCCGWSV